MGAEGAEQFSASPALMCADMNEVEPTRLPQLWIAVEIREIEKGMAKE